MSQAGSSFLCVMAGLIIAGAVCVCVCVYLSSYEVNQCQTILGIYSWQRSDLKLHLFLKHTVQGCFWGKARIHSQIEGQSNTFHKSHTFSTASFLIRYVCKVSDEVCLVFFLIILIHIIVLFCMCNIVKSIFNIVKKQLAAVNQQKRN